MNKQFIYSLIIGGSLRFLLANSYLGQIIGDRVEISTPLNSFKRLQEGVHLYGNNIDPYQGDVVHEMPLLLAIWSNLFVWGVDWIPVIYVLTDCLTALLLFLISRDFVLSKLLQQESEKQSYAADSHELQVQPSDFDAIPRCVFYAYIYNPLLVLNCAGLTSTVFGNFFLALTLYCLSKRFLHGSLFFLAIETMRSMYPVVLLAPIVLVFQRKRNSIAYSICIVMLFALMCATIAWVNFCVLHSWSFLNGTLGFIFFYRDLQPNIGLFWYFFTEMFDHFRTMFLITFQMNATVLYLLPLSFKLRREPFLLATVLIALMSVFRSYPCLGDVGFYLALLPLWRRCWKFMAHNFVVFSFFLVTLLMLPALWHLWIYAGSANANFYFGTTLAFSTGQIFLVTDLLFAYVKREFCLRNGQKIFIDGKEAKIVLE